MIAGPATARARSGRRARLSLGLIVGASVLLLVLGGTPQLVETRRALGFLLAPVQGALAEIGRTGRSFADALSELDKLRVANRELEERNASLEVELERLAELRVQNTQLQALLGLRDALPQRSVAAAVIGRGRTESRALSLDRGTDDGVAVGDVVVANGAALVGRVVEVGPNFSRLLMINDERSVVGGILRSTRALGEVRGDVGGSLTMTGISASDGVVVGDVVLTAGLDLGRGVRSAYPKGLVVGRVTDVRHDPNEVIQTALVAPAAALERVEYVLVLTGYDGASDPP